VKDVSNKEGTIFDIYRWEQQSRWWKTGAPGTK
jgi:hypothetical protein